MEASVSDVSMVVGDGGARDWKRAVEDFRELAVFYFSFFFPIKTIILGEFLFLLNCCSSQ